MLKNSDIQLDGCNVIHHVEKLCKGDTLTILEF